MQLQSSNYKNFDPYLALDIKKSDQLDPEFLKNQFRKAIKKNDNFLVTISMDYLSLLVNKDPKLTEMYKPLGHDQIEFKPSTIMDYVQINQLSYLQNYFSQQENVQNLNILFANNQTLLYASCRSGYYEMVQYLLQIGADVNKPRENPLSYPINAAAHYGHQQIVDLLTKAGADFSVKNEYNNTPIEESKTENIQKIMKTSQGDEFDQFFRKLKDKDMVLGYTEYVMGDKVLAKKYSINPKFIPDQHKQVYQLIYNEDWVTAYHGTKKKFVESIITNGLKRPGEKTKDNLVVEIPYGHIEAGVEVAGIKDWSNAIFCSPSINYVHNYAETLIDSKGKQWDVIFQLRVRPGSYGEFANTLMDGVLKEQHGEDPDQIEWRIGSKSLPSDPLYKNNSVYRVQEETSVIVKSLLMVNWGEFQDSFDTQEKVNKFLMKNQIDDAQKFFFIFACGQVLDSAVFQRSVLFDK